MLSIDRYVIMAMSIGNFDHPRYIYLKGMKKLFSIIKQIKKDKIDVVGAKLINGNLLVKDQTVKERWRTYFAELLNKENLYITEEGELT